MADNAITVAQIREERTVFLKDLLKDYLWDARQEINEALKEGFVTSKGATKDVVQVHLNPNLSDYLKEVLMNLLIQEYLAAGFTVLCNEMVVCIWMS